MLGDRPVEITLRRAWEALSLGERLDLAKIFAGLAFERAWGGPGSPHGVRRSDVGLGVEGDAVEEV